MQNNILNYLGKVHAQYIHARGIIGTNVIIKILNCQPNEVVLEIGFGTGTTLVRLFSIHRQTKFFGLEQSQLMLEKAKSRLRFSFIGKSVKLSLMNNKCQIPFETNSFDKIYLESVLAIQEGNDLETLLLEISRVLRPHGVLVMNETIWLDETNIDEITRINELCKRDFGIIQCTAQYPYLKNWLDLLTKLHFECNTIIRLDNIKDKTKPIFRFSHQLPATIFTFLGKIKPYLNPSLRKEKATYLHKMKQINPPNKQLMEGIIIKVNNNKQTTV